MKFSYSVFASVMTFAFVATAVPMPQDIGAGQQGAAVLADGTAGTPPPPAAPELITTSGVGGTGGDPFDDTEKLSQPIAKINRFIVRSGERINQVQTNLNFVSGPDNLIHGSDEGGAPIELNLIAGEGVNNIQLFQGGGRVVGIVMNTNQGNSLTAGTVSGNPLSQNSPQAGFTLVGFSGRAAEEIDFLAPIWGNVPL